MDNQHNGLRAFSLGLTLSAAMLPALWSAELRAVSLSGADMVDYTAYPVTTLENVTPQVMLTMSRDHQYFYKAYNDYTDLDDDGDVDSTYKNSFEYYGYFDPNKCYSYESTNPTADGLGAYNAFVPKAFGSDHYCDAVSGEWSGNFLNWASMTRMDIVRKITHGGLRRSDTPTQTVLERAHLPTDAHSFAKYYSGDDISKLTPFTGILTDADHPGPTGTDAQKQAIGITICNTTRPGTTNNSQTVTSETNAPQLRVVKGNYALWNAEEVFQCHWRSGTGDSGERGGSTAASGNGNIPAQSGLDASAVSPHRTNDGLTFGGFGPEFNAFVEVCKTGLIDHAANAENCRRYPDGNYKPTGLLQEYGENETIHFGLMTGTYGKNTKGGVLRKNIGPISDEINIDTDGTLKKIGATDLAPQYVNTSTVGIIRTLDKLRIFGYRYGGTTSAARYFDSGSGDSCGFQLNAIPANACFSWGNPLSEIYAETIRYYAGLTATAAFAATDHSKIPGLAEATWIDPLNEDNFCAALNTVVFNASLSSYDHDDTGVFTTIPGAPSPVSLTDDVGAAEGYDGEQYFIGRTATETNEFCSGKTIAGLGKVAGLCPEGPTVDGTYHIAGMAHYAHTNDIRPATLLGDQKVTTYAVQLATNVPRIEIPVDSATTVTVLPAYRLVFNNGGGSLVDFKIVQKHIEVDPDVLGFLPTGETGSGEVDPATVKEKPGSGVFYGKFMVLWEDSEQGGDYDKDMWGVISYRLDTTVTPAKVHLTTNAVNAATANGQLFGFIISGTTQDGFHAYSGIFNGTFSDPDSTLRDCNDSYPNITGVTTNTDGNCDVSDSARTYAFTVGSGGAGLLPDPLFLAAKYGAFIDENGNDLPDLESEFNARDKDGNIVAGGDPGGTPDTYFFVNNPAALEASLRAVFNQIIERVASGTAAAVVASEQEGTGAVFQALYDPVKSDTLGNEARWIGTLQAIFVDPQGFLREDGDQDQKLDGYDVDKVVEIFYDETEKRARVRRYDSLSALEFIQTGFTVDELENLRPIWNSRKQLSAVTDVTSQRVYEMEANTGRHILTWLDNDLDGLVAADGSEQVPFVQATFDDDNFGWLDIWDGVTLDASEAHKLVDYVRGEEQDGYRTRVVDYDGNGTVELMRLGDIVHSTPTVQGAPAEAFDLLSLDESYSAFRNQYRNRRNVVYVGANDGMIHAFNGGFFDVSERAFKTSLTSEAAHPLGSELWAYIPKNLLGHLQWLADEEYTHVYFSDLKPLLFDAKIFDDDADHPNGWGTVLVVGMRLGGGNDANGIVLDTAADGIGGADGDGDTGDDVATKSAYVVLDVTNPEVPPRVIAELSPPGQFFTTSFPAAVVMGEAIPSASATPPNKWYLLTGSGPTTLGSAASGQTARVFGYDLRELVLGNSGLIESGPFSVGTPSDGIGFVNTPDANTFVGEFTVADQDLDMKAEAVYFGTVGNESGTGGNFFRMAVNEEILPSDWDAPIKLLAVDRPFATRASITIDQQFRTWLMVGTGRLYTNLDKESTAQQTLYGFIDPFASAGTPPAPPLDHADFEDVTNAVTLTTGAVDLDGDGTQDTTYEAFENTVAASGGWFLDYELGAAVADPSERQVANPTLIGGIVLATAFTPSLDLCGAEGESRLLGRAFNSGLVPPGGIFGTVPCPSCPTGVEEAVGSISLGKGLASSPSIHIGNQDVPGKVTVIVQQSTGAITGTQAQTLGGLRNGEISWQEFRSE